MRNLVTHNENKSNRSRADYGELMVIKSLCATYKLPFIYEPDLAVVLEKMLSLEDGLDKKSQEEQNIPLLVQGCEQVIQKCELKNITAVEWSGRNREEGGGTADLLIKNENDVLRISLKSIKRDGKGTLKNTGASSFTALGISYENIYEQMKSTVIKGVPLHYNDNQEILAISQVKELSRTHKEIKKIANTLSAPFIKEINLLIFNSLVQSKVEVLNNFVNEILLDVKEKDLWTVMVNENGLTVDNQTSSCKVSPQDIISVQDLKDKGFKIFKNGKKFIRVNTCCTNGKGLSAVCQRYFFDF